MEAAPRRVDKRFKITIPVVAVAGVQPVNA
jgi:hypothetical protein